MKVEDLLFNEQFNEYYHNWSPETKQRLKEVLEKVDEVCGEYDAWFASTTNNLRCGYRKKENKKGKNLFTFFFSQHQFGMWISRRGPLSDDGGLYLKSGEENNYHELKQLDSGEQLDFALTNLRGKVLKARDASLLPQGREGYLPEYYLPEDDALSIRDKVILEFKDCKGQVFSSKEIEAILYTNQNIKRNSAPPGDYCYNRYNAGLDKNKSSELRKQGFIERAIFEHTPEGFLHLGKNSDYSGDIHWNPKEKNRDPVLIGRWEDGRIVYWDLSEMTNEASKTKDDLEIVMTIDNTEEQRMLATNRIYFGPPGTGKTHILQTEVFSQYQGDTEDEQRYRFVTFHPSYSYEEFVEGIRAETNAEGQISYAVKNGIFRDLCEQAQEDPNHRYALIIDEINRGNMAKILGELITLIEPDKRLGAEHELAVTLPYSGDVFGVPQNLDIYGTMNTADRSLALMDNALRRRFEFKEMQADPCLLSSFDSQAVPTQYRDAVAAKPLQEHADDLKVQGINLRLLLTVINLRIERIYDRDHTLGHAFLLPVKKALVLGEEQAFVALQSAFADKIIPLLEEYFFEDWDKIRKVLADDQKSAVALQFIQTEEDANLPSYDVLFSGDAPRRGLTSYQKNADALLDITAYQEIYLSACKKSKDVTA
ncbi:MAG: hypothetical protein COA47_15890 [Robiginitomaculum sp.]|nr:MAG: hypothetical protein COA47_15890 [Robiginitomaculum sp.]